MQRGAVGLLEVHHEHPDPHADADAGAGAGAGPESNWELELSQVNRDVSRIRIYFCIPEELTALRDAAYQLEEKIFSNATNTREYYVKLDGLLSSINRKVWKMAMQRFDDLFVHKQEEGRQTRKCDKCGQYADMTWEWNANMKNTSQQEKEKEYMAFLEQDMLVVEDSDYGESIVEFLEAEAYIPQIHEHA